MRAGACDFTQKLLPFKFNFLITTTNNNHCLHRTKPFFLQPHRMATEGPRAEITPVSHPIEPKLDPSAAEKNGDPPEIFRKEVPPPPEKPEPGDCCGSGCVRCVWYIYYEELEAYNKLLKQEPNLKS